MNAQDQTNWGRALWNMAAEGPERKLLPESGWKVDVLNEGSGAIIDTESCIVILRAERPGVFNRTKSPPAPVRHPLGYHYVPLGAEINYKCSVAFQPVPDDISITAEIFQRPVQQERVPPRPPTTVTLPPRTLWAMRSIWNSICRLTDGERDHARGFRIVDGETPGRTVFITCGKVVWHLKSENPRAFRRDPTHPEAWKPLPADAPIDGTMTV